MIIARAHVRRRPRADHRRVLAVRRPARAGRRRGAAEAAEAVGRDRSPPKKSRLLKPLEQFSSVGVLNASLTRLRPHLGAAPARHHAGGSQRSACRRCCSSALCLGSGGLPDRPLPDVQLDAGDGRRRRRARSSRSSFVQAGAQQPAAEVRRTVPGSGRSDRAGAAGRPCLHHRRADGRRRDSGAGRRASSSGSTTSRTSGCRCRTRCAASRRASR